MMGGRNNFQQNMPGGRGGYMQPRYGGGGGGGGRYDYYDRSGSNERYGEYAERSPIIPGFNNKRSYNGMPHHQSAYYGGGGAGDMDPSAGYDDFAPVKKSRRDW